MFSAGLYSGLVSNCPGSFLIVPGVVLVARGWYFQPWYQQWLATASTDSEIVPGIIKTTPRTIGHEPGQLETSLCTVALYFLEIFW